MVSVRMVLFLQRGYVQSASQAQSRALKQCDISDVKIFRWSHLYPSCTGSSASAATGTRQVMMTAELHKPVSICLIALHRLALPRLVIYVYICQTALYPNNYQSDKERILKITGQQKKVFHPQLPGQYSSMSSDMLKCNPNINAALPTLLTFTIPVRALNEPQLQPRCNNVETRQLVHSVPSTSAIRITAFTN